MIVSQLSSDRLATQPIVPPLNVQLETNSALAPVLKNEDQQLSTCLHAYGATSYDGDDGTFGGANALCGADMCSCDDGLQGSGFISAPQPQGEPHKSACGRLLAARWRSCLDAGKGATPLNTGCAIEQKVEIRGLQGSHLVVPNYNNARCGNDHYAEADDNAYSGDKGKNPVYLTRYLSVPKLPQKAKGVNKLPQKTGKGSAVDDTQVPYASCVPLADRSHYSSTPKLTRKGCLPCLIGSKTSIQPKLINYEHLQTTAHHISPLPRRASSAGMRREREESRLSKAQVKARHHKKCIQRSAARRVGKSNWRSFLAEEFDV